MQGKGNMHSSWIKCLEKSRGGFSVEEDFDFEELKKIRYEQWVLSTRLQVLINKIANQKLAKEKWKPTPYINTTFIIEIYHCITIPFRSPTLGLKKVDKRQKNPSFTVWGVVKPNLNPKNFQIILGTANEEQGNSRLTFHFIFWFKYLYKGSPPVERTIYKPRRLFNNYELLWRRTNKEKQLVVNSQKRRLLSNR